MKYLISDFRADTANLIQICRRELVNRKNGVNGESTVKQIEEVILPELNILLHKLNDNNLPPLENRYLNSFANAFTIWGWNMECPTELFVKLTELNNNYKRVQIK